MVKIGDVVELDNEEGYGDLFMVVDVTDKYVILKGDPVNSEFNVSSGWYIDSSEGLIAFDIDKFNDIEPLTEDEINDMKGEY